MDPCHDCWLTAACYDVSITVYNPTPPHPTLPHVQSPPFPLPCYPWNFMVFIYLLQCLHEFLQKNHRFELPSNSNKWTKGAFDVTVLFTRNVICGDTHAVKADGTVTRLCWRTKRRECLNRSDSRWDMTPAHYTVQPWNKQFPSVSGENAWTDQTQGQEIFQLIIRSNHETNNCLVLAERMPGQIRLKLRHNSSSLYGPTMSVSRENGWTDQTQGET